MQNVKIGIQIDQPNAPAAVAAILQAEALGLDAAWMTLGGARPDPLPIFAAAAERTERIALGTSIIPTFPRHPLALASTARAVAELAPGRLRLGVGPSHKLIIQDAWGIPFDRPLAHLREYLQLLRAALQQGGRLDFNGAFFHVHLDCGQPVDLKIMASALRGNSYAVAGELADGAISWVSPLHHIQQVAIPALTAAAAAAGRPRPAMVMHVPVCVDTDRAAVLAVARQRLGIYPRQPFYARMFEAAGFPEAAEGTLSDRLLDAIIVHGHADAVAGRLRQIAAAGVDELLCSVLPTAADPAAASERTLRLLSELCAQP